MRRLLVLLALARPALADGFDRHRLAVPAGVRSLATDGELVVVLTYDDTLVAVRRDGTPRFRVKLEHSSSVGVELAVIGDRVLVLASDFVLGLDARTGAERWRRTAAPMDMLSTTLAGTFATIAADAGIVTVDVHSGRESPPPAIAAPTSDPIVDAQLGDSTLELVAPRWHLTATLPAGSSWTHQAFADLTLVARRGKSVPELVAIDSRTGARRWVTRLRRDDALQAVFRGGGLIWLVVDDGTARDNGELVDRVLAIREDHGGIVKEIVAPTRDVKYCAVSVLLASAGGIMAVAHGIADKDRCSVAVVDVYARR